IVSKGPKVTRFDLKKASQPTADIATTMLGPTGNLRAPTLRVGKTLLIGFNEDVYAEVLT
ncbi:MAG: hypothetical protein GXP29_01165, partial [Planctomycetes bacterium]|nr:hypothetical protein [Planctomycetota bacterium]